ncbi:MAG: T9SS type A sorting domain-containing protein, partial [Bacteroidales bacterium]|nr:T9SS type A sorting domain-containing protein [Bacteroidales bacterium]
GYRFVQWSDCLATAKRTDSNVSADLSVTAEFEKQSSDEDGSSTGLFDIRREMLSAYPNPTMGMLWVSVPEPVEGTAAEVMLFNASGQLLQRVPARSVSSGSAASRISINLSGYPSGMYIIRVGNAMAKVVKQ